MAAEKMETPRFTRCCARLKHGLHGCLTIINMQIKFKLVHFMGNNIY